MQQLNQLNLRFFLALLEAPDLYFRFDDILVK